jgi:hypothetical protein
MTAPRADAGTAIECHLCGEQVRVPRRPHPVESIADDDPPVPLTAAAAARTGTQLLVLSLAVAVAEYAALAVAVAGWASLQARGPEADAGELRAVLVAAWAIDLVLLAVRVGLKWVGYRRCEPAAEAVQANGWVAAARFAALGRAIGYAGMVTPWLLAPGPDPGVPLLAVAVAGRVVWLLGAVAEFAVLVAWSRLLTVVGGTDAARRVAVYAVTFAVAMLTVAFGVCLAGLVTAAAGGPPGQVPRPPHGGPPRLNLDALPAEGRIAFAAVAAVTAAFGVVLVWQYLRVLTAVRAGLTRA